MTDQELNDARRELTAAVRARMPSTWPIEALKAVTYIIRMAPPIEPSHEYGKPRLSVVQ